MRDGGPGKDGIPSLDSPQFASASNTTYLSDDDLVIGVNVDGELRAYPHKILDWHEIVNDEIGQTAVAITYCPLTGSGIGWNRVLAGTKTTFGVSGLLWNTNLIPYDRATGSNWSQMRLECVNGANIGTDVQTVPVIETTWRTWRALYPDSKVVSNVNDVYVSSLYQRYPYGDYRTNHGWLLFPVGVNDGRLPRKERVHGVAIGDKATAFRFESFPDSMTVINTDVDGEPIVAVGSRESNFIVAYHRRLDDGTTATFVVPEAAAGPTAMVSADGTAWDLFGVGLDGPRKSERLSAAPSYTAFWFAWAAFHPGTGIHGQ